MIKTTSTLILATLLLSAAASGKTEPAAVLHGCGGRAVEFSRDGAKLMTAGKEAARVWDGHTFKPVTGPLKHGGEILFAYLSADGNRALTAGSDRTACVWDAETGKVAGERQHRR